MFDISKQVAQHPIYVLGTEKIDGQFFYGLICNCGQTHVDKDGNIPPMTGHEACYGHLFVILQQLGKVRSHKTK